MFSEIEVAIKYSKKVESLLSEKLGAEGKGLNHKLTSVEKGLSKHLVKRVRYLARVRNKVVHDDSFSLPDVNQFVLVCEGIVVELKNIHPANVAANYAKRKTSSTQRAEKLGKLDLFIYTLLLLIFTGFIYIAAI